MTWELKCLVDLTYFVWTLFEWLCYKIACTRVLSPFCWPYSLCQVRQCASFEIHFCVCQLPLAAHSVLLAFSVWLLGLLCSCFNSSELTARQSSRSDTVFWQFPAWCENFSVFWHIQHESKHFTPLRFSENISPMTVNFQMKFYTPIVCSFIRWVTKFYSFVSNSDKVMPHKVRPSSECLHFTACRWWWIVEPAHLHCYNKIFYPLLIVI